jgi:hypothetical protein
MTTSDEIKTKYIRPSRVTPDIKRTFTAAIPLRNSTRG